MNTSQHKYQAMGNSASRALTTSLNASHIIAKVIHIMIPGLHVPSNGLLELSRSDYIIQYLTHQNKSNT
jgi:hypothetical protein